MAIEGAGNDRKADNRTVIGKQKLEVQPVWVCRAATETTVVGRVGKGRQVFVAFSHAGLAAL